MNKIISVEDSIRVSEKLRQQGKQIVLVGGCFDILHLGHINFLENSKNLGDILFVLLESDEAVGKLKGKDRPINNQIERAQILSALSIVSYVILLPLMKTDKDYDKLITQIKPAFIAATENDPNISHKIRQAKMIDGKVKIVTKRVDNKSTTKLARLISKENIL
ncbi:MAG: adenylyltransferase/cytidyltransferase family protein [Patescibacteria group bacterium]